MATYICHKWRSMTRLNRPVVSAPTIVHRTPMSYTEADLYESIKLAYGEHIKVSLKHTHHQFALSIQPIAPCKNPFTMQKIKPIYDFMKRWGQEAYLIQLLDFTDLTDANANATEIPLPMYYAVKDPSNI